MSALVQPMERQDIHKSCRTIETLSGVLSDYCDAASAFAAIQKKLAKALRDVAGLKTNAQFAANAFGASSIILEVLADVDGKFAKIAEKESHSVRSEVKKWFKKLAKEEKAHDERMNDSNARIKQAGQVYEKKSKKGAKDAGEEHARYINLLSVIGPEMSQDKHNHAAHVTHQNTLVTFSVATSVSRIADAEWSRTCECMRRISPTIGSLGEWRSLCEGAWTGPLPDDLPQAPSDPVQPPTATSVSEWGQTGLSTPARRSLPVPPVSNRSPGSVSVSAVTSLDPPRSPFGMADQNQGSMNSITTLSAFPFPPTHFPVPLTMNEAELQRQRVQLPTMQSVHSRAGSPSPNQPPGALVPPVPALTDPPKQAAVPDLPESPGLDTSKSLQYSQISRTPSSSHQSSEAPPDPTLLPEDKGVIRPITAGAGPKKPRRLSLIARIPPPSDKPTGPASSFKKAEHSSTEKEFGVHSDNNRSAFKSHSVDAARKDLERTDSTHSAGGNVAALRSKYIRPVETQSQAPKDIPRLPKSVSEIASRYQPADEPMSPRRTASPIVERFPTDTPCTSPLDIPIDENELRRRKQRIDELAELELKEKEYELRQRERELNQRTRDFERDRFQYLHSRPDPANATAEGPRGPRTSPFRHQRGSQSVTHVNVPSSTSSSGTMRPATSHSPSRSPVLPSKDHAPFCGCDTCSVAQYKAMPTQRDLRPPEPPILLRPEKPKGWIRRLSMPSVNMAFSLDAKKNASALSLKAGLPLPAENGRIRKRSYEHAVSNRTIGR